tara:strand:- start:499 stop:870 length:372 start_codon:yes stop_codon:yes gene_type:complete
MTRFTKDNLHKDGPYIFYAEPADRWNPKAHKFVARFKRVAGAGSFMTHLRKNWTVEDFFAELDAGGTGPLTIVKKTGYLLPHIKKWLKNDGYPTTPAGYEAWHAWQMEKADARQAARDAAASA